MNTPLVIASVVALVIAVYLAVIWRAQVRSHRRIEASPEFHAWVRATSGGKHPPRYIKDWR